MEDRHLTEDIIKTYCKILNIGEFGQISFGLKYGPVRDASEQIQPSRKAMNFVTFAF